MSEHVKLKRQKLLLLALKTAIGGSAAIYIAEKIGLQFAPSAGIIAMLSLVLLGNFSLDVWQMD